MEETEQLLAEHNSFKEKARETREKVNYTLLSELLVFQYLLERCKMKADNGDCKVFKT